MTKSMLWDENIGLFSYHDFDWKQIECLLSVKRKKKKILLRLCDACLCFNSRKFLVYILPIVLQQNYICAFIWHDNNYPLMLIYLLNAFFVFMAGRRCKGERTWIWIPSWCKSNTFMFTIPNVFIFMLSLI